MLKTKEMQKVRLVASKNQLKSLIDVLHSLNILHLKSYSKKEEDYFDIAHPLENAENYSKKLLEVRAIFNALNIIPKHTSFSKKVNLNKISKLREEFSNIYSKLENVNSEKKDLQKQLENPLINLKLPKGHENEFKSINGFFGTVNSDIESAMEKFSGKIQFNKFKLNNSLAISLFVSNDIKDEIKKTLSKYDFKECEKPKFSQKEINSKLAFIITQETSLNKEIETFKEINLEYLIAAENFLSTELQKSNAPLNFASSKNAFFVEGYLPVDNLKKLKEVLQFDFQGKVYFEKLKNEENMPVALNNPVWVKPYEYLLDLYAVPKYGSIDPSLLMAFVFPIFFGFTLGDMGYGLISLALFLFLKRKLKGETIQLMLEIMIVSSFATIAFGIIYTEIFGMELSEFLGLFGVHIELHGLISRSHDIMGVMILSIVIGVIHITLGLLLGFLEVFRKHGLVQAFFHKGGWLMLEWGLIITLLSFSGIFQGMIEIGAGILLIGLITIVKGEGIIGAIELPSIISNILSYTRLFGFGLASVQLAFLTNLFAKMFISQGSIFIVAAIFIILLGHSLNLVLGLYGPFLQALRLHYVEFFTKFYEGGGIKYSPFGSFPKKD